MEGVQVTIEASDKRGKEREAVSSLRSFLVLCPDRLPPKVRIATPL